MHQVVGTETVILSVVSNLIGLLRLRLWVLSLACHLLCLRVSLSGEVGEWGGGTGELAAHLGGLLAGVWVHNVVFIIKLSSQEVEESLLLIVNWLSLTFDGSFSLGSFLFGVLSHPEECIEQAESGNDEDDEEVHNLEGNISLFLKIIPLILNNSCFR